MKKGFSIFTLILALVVLVVLALILFGPGGLLTKSKEKAFDIANKSLGEEKPSVPGEIAVEDYFGINFVLSDKKKSPKILAKAVVDCYNMCQEKEEDLFCNYIEVVDENFGVGDIFDSLSADMKERFSIENFISCLGPDRLRIGRMKGDYCEEKTELCCSTSKVYLTKLGKCMTYV